MAPTAMVCTLGRRGRWSLAGARPLRPVEARAGLAALSAHAAQAPGELWDQTSTGWMGGRGSSSPGSSPMLWGALDSPP
eukprot:2065589-Heterocapsa_arctica.AAC.1